MLEQAKQKGLPIGWVAIALASLLAFFTASAGAQVTTPRTNAVARVESVGFTVSDMDKAIDFYTRVLPFEKVFDVETFGAEIESLSGVFGARVRVVRLKLGDEALELTEYLTPRGRPIPADSRSNDRWFQHIAIIVSDMDKAYAHLRSNKVRHASTAPQTLPSYITAAAGIRAFYFKDFDDHVLEILAFPADKGAAKWHELSKSGKLFLGIDHTAIVVADTDTSLGFYRDALGLKVVGESTNYGSEQEHLNNVAGARLHITGLRPADGGINIEFLEYLAPANGRAYPTDSQSNDHWHWQTSFLLSVGINDVFRSKPPVYISPGAVLFEKPIFGFRRAALVRDPDGHAVRVVEAGGNKNDSGITDN
jgi:catechol 2,3-dioxygenase-like lactoylglutathione lyase family enzyme